MSESMQDQSLQLSWLTWWHHGFWLAADKSWHGTRFASLESGLQQRVVHQYASRLYASLAIPPTPPGEPQRLVLAISELSADARQRLLYLVAEICGCAAPLDAGLKIWCRRIAKGLRAESWLPPALFADGQCTHSALLLQALYPQLWPRLRLLFPSMPPTPALALPASRLLPLWQAALWQCQQREVGQNLAEASHVAP